ncbi:MAG: Biotin transporter BioY [Chlamydiae bacterium]|nr:Biotin transporter BioY [Chlamydiota bacterium]
MRASIRTAESTYPRMNETIRFLSHILLGSLFLAALSQVEIPLAPIPVTLQTFAIFLLALFQGSTKAFFSALLYLGEATMGLPVLSCAACNPLWFIGPTAGYLFSFPLAAFVIGKVFERKNAPSICWTALSIFCGQIVIFALGISWLSFYVGWNQALPLGLYPFLPMAVLKLVAAVSFKMADNKLRPYLSSLL